jgi:hypothetical protein
MAPRIILLGARKTGLLTSRGIMDQWTIRKDFESFILVERERERERCQARVLETIKKCFRIETVILGAHAQKGNTSSV